MALSIFACAPVSSVRPRLLQTLAFSASTVRVSTTLLVLASRMLPASTFTHTAPVGALSRYTRRSPLGCSTAMSWLAVTLSSSRAALPTLTRMGAAVVPTLPPLAVSETWPPETLPAPAVASRMAPVLVRVTSWSPPAVMLPSVRSPPTLAMLMLPDTVEAMSDEPAFPSSLTEMALVAPLPPMVPPADVVRSVTTLAEMVVLALVARMLPADVTVTALALVRPPSRMTLAPDCVEVMVNAAEVAPMNWMPMLFEAVTSVV